jgi:hypothetical protein
VIREVGQIVKTFPNAEQEAFYPFIAQLKDYTISGKIARAQAVVQAIGTLPTVTQAHKDQVKTKIGEAA